jgi:hypothetical protein
MVSMTHATEAAPSSGTVAGTIPIQTLFSGPQGPATLQGSVTGFFTPR